MKYYIYKYIPGSTLTRWTVEDILKAVKTGLKKFDLVIDLGLKKIVAEVKDNNVVIDGVAIDFNTLEKVKEGFVYKVVEGELRRLDMYREGKYYKLKPVASDKAPTIEINGIHMHRVSGVDPWRDAIAKIKSISKKIKGAKVLDICTGLGYTAIAEVMFGAESVTSIEVDENVLNLASANPWSRGLEHPRIKIIIGDALEVLDKLKPESFDVVVHDPPRFEVAGELYSLEFYRKIHNVLRRGGILLHYTGNPGKHSNIDILKGVKNRLDRAGFEDIKWIEFAKGFKAVKVV
ncbi:MAG: methyltransferase domain-containing protein [Ignisphaera sp.]